MVRSKCHQVLVHVIRVEERSLLTVKRL
jgi:hypothetical protein